MKWTVTFAVLALGACAASAAPAPQSPRAVVEAVFAAFNRHDVDALASHYSDDTLLTSSDHCHAMRGPAELRRIHAELLSAIPDVHDELTDTVVDGDRVAVRFISRGHVSGQAFELEIADFFRIERGLVIEDRTIFDNGGRPCQP